MTAGGPYDQDVPAAPSPSDSLILRFSELTEASAARPRDAVLRTLDIVFSAFFLLLSLPLTIPIALLLLVTSGRPLFYRGERVGRGGRVFEMLKFRTLRRGAEDRLGPFLGEELADELPAYWQRLVVRPGLTGFAQVRRGYETSMAEKLAHDLEWIADRSVRLYLRTLGTTALRVLRQFVRGIFGR